MRPARARLLAGRYPDAAEPLLVVARALDVADAARPAWDHLPALQSAIHAAIQEIAPPPLRDAIPQSETLSRYLLEPAPFSPSSFCARIALEAWAKVAPLQWNDPKPNECPRCGHAPQLGVLRTEGQGQALTLACSLCRNEWPFRRGTCPQCLETDSDRIAFYAAEDSPHVRTQTCQSCRTYLHLLIPENEPGMIPELDEMALLTLDAWAATEDFSKVWPNLAGA